MDLATWKTNQREKGSLVYDMGVNTMDHTIYLALSELNDKFQWLYDQLIAKGIIIEEKEDGKNSKPK